MASLNVLITAGSRRVPLVEAFRRSLCELNVDGSVIVSDVDVLSPTVHVADRAYAVSSCSSEDYLAEIEEICDAERIGLVVPTIDEELPIFGAARSRFAALGVTVFTSSRRTAEQCNDKYETCRVLRARDVPAAESFLPDTLPAEPSFPLFVKPRFGRGSVAAFHVRHRRDLEFFLSYVNQPVLQDYIDGPEFTIDMLCDRRGRPLSIVPRERIVIRAGVSDRGRTVDDPRLVDLAVACADVFEFCGAVNIQCRLADGEPTVFEINPRYSGGIPLTIAAGGDFPRMMIELVLGRDVRPRIGVFDRDLWMTNYESPLFLTSEELAMPMRSPMPRLREAV